MIDISETERRHAFSMWLRTGRWPVARGADGTELKFNPWHDPRDGRFTFANSDNYQGRGWGGGGFTGGGGGRTGGGGATGPGWETPAERERRKHASREPSAAGGHPLPAKPGGQITPARKTKASVKARTDANPGTNAKHPATSHSEKKSSNCENCADLYRKIAASFGDQYLVYRQRPDEKPAISQ